LKTSKRRNNLLGEIINTINQIENEYNEILNQKFKYEKIKKENLVIYKTKINKKIIEIEIKLLDKECSFYSIKFFVDDRINIINDHKEILKILSFVKQIIFENINKFNGIIFISSDNNSSRIKLYRLFLNKLDGLKTFVKKFKNNTLFVAYKDEYCFQKIISKIKENPQEII
jgi:hypothetical protein